LQNVQTVRSFSVAPKPFKILGIQQIAIGGLNKGDLAKFWIDSLGIEKVGTYKAEVRFQLPISYPQELIIYLS